MGEILILFGYETYYPAGGWNDVVGVFHSRDEALAAIKTRNKAADNYAHSTGKDWEYVALIEHAHLVDATTMTRVADWDLSDGWDEQ